MTKDGKKIDVVVQTTKQGFIFMFDRVTGKPIHPIQEIPVPQTKLESEYTSPTQPVPTFFKPFVRQALTEVDFMQDGISEESHADLLKRSRALDQDNMWNPLTARGRIQSPGLNGGGEWGGPSFDPGTGIMYVNGNESPWVIGARTRIPENVTNARPGQTDLKLVSRSTKRIALDVTALTDPSLLGIEKQSNMNPSLKFDEASFKSLITTGRHTMPPFAYLTDGQKTAIAPYVLNIEARQKEPFQTASQPDLPEYYRNPYKEARVESS